MIELNKLVALCLILASIIMSIPANAQEKAMPYWITGRAVDGKGNPVVGAQVLINYPSCSGCIDQILPSTKTQENGAFAISTESLPEKGLKLYAEGPVPKGFYSPFSPPFDELRHNPRFSGSPLIFNKKGLWKIDMGDVLIKVLYAKVRIDLVAMFGKNYQASQSAVGNINFTLRDNYGKEVYNGSLPEPLAFDLTYTFANIALTKGKWTLIFTLYDKKQMIVSYRLSLNINNLGCTTVTFRRGRQQFIACK